MRIGYEAKRIFSNSTGLGNYARTLVGDLLQHTASTGVSQSEGFEVVLFTPRVSRSFQTAEFFDHNRVEICTASGPFGSLWRIWGQGRTAQKKKLDLYHGLSNELPLDFSLFSGMPLVVTIHDLLFKRFKSDYSAFDRALYDFKFRNACNRATVIAATSYATQQDLENFYKVPAERIQVVHQSCARAFYGRADEETKRAIKEKYQLPDEFVLSVGSVIERKNLLGVIQALRFMPLPVPLVVVGQGNEYLRQVQEYIAANKLQSQVLFRSDISFSDLPVVYQLSSCLVYVSFGEGFGIPVLEGLASGVPVVTSNVSSMPEAGGQAALLVDPADPQEIAAVLQEVLENTQLRAQCVAKGLVHAEKFSSAAVTNRLLSVYRSLL